MSITRDVRKWNIRKVMSGLWRVVDTDICVIRFRREWYVVKANNAAVLLSPPFPTRHAALAYWFDDVPF